MFLLMCLELIYLVLASVQALFCSPYFMLYMCVCVCVCGTVPFVLLHYAPKKSIIYTYMREIVI